jgi:hypothetical protein
MGSGRQVPKNKRAGAGSRRARDSGRNQDHQTYVPMGELCFNRREFLIAAGAVAVSNGSAPERAEQLQSDELAAGFDDPPWEARPSTYWVWLNGFTDSHRLTYELEELKRAGVNAVYILEIGGSGVPAGPSYMGPESIRAIGHAVREAARLGLEVGITSASSWNSGGSWVSPEHASKGLYWAQVSVEGPIRFSEVLPFPKLPATVPRTPAGAPAFCSEVAVMAVPEQERLPGFDFLFDLGPGLHTVDRVTLHNVAAESAVKGFADMVLPPIVESIRIHSDIVARPRIPRPVPSSKVVSESLRAYRLRPRCFREFRHCVTAARRSTR